jgi:S-formylglutathione hydrolase FrmB
MGLTSGFFMGLMIAVAVGSVAATVWLWPQFAGQRIRMVAARFGLIAVGQLLLLAAVLVFLNGFLGFFGSWSALFGSGLPVAAARAVASSQPIVVTGSDLGGAAAAAQSVGKILQVTVSGEHTGIVSAANYVYLPPQYFQPAYAHVRFPVVLALTGYPNATWSIVRWLRLPATAAHLVASGKIRPAVYVIMNVSVALPRDTECTNVPEGPQAETFLAQDVPHAVDQTFRVQTGSAGWAVLGYSTGGYCAAKLAMMYPYQFSAAVSLAGYYTADQDITTGNLYGGSTAFQDENDLDWRLAHLPAPPVSVLVTSSQVGELDLADTLTFLRLIHPPMHGYSLILAQGGHNYGTWVRQLPQSLEWLNQRLSPAVPQAQPTPAPGR